MILYTKVANKIQVLGEAFIDFKCIVRRKKMIWKKKSKENGVDGNGSETNDRISWNNLKKDTRDNITYYLLMLIPITFIIVFCYAPMYGIVIAFQKYTAGKPFFGSGVEWVGLKWFKEFVSSYYFSRILRNTIRLSLMGLVIGFPIPILFALTLNELKLVKFKKFTQTVSYMPNFLSTVIIAGMVISFTNADGIITSIAKLLGYQDQTLLLNADVYPWLFVITNVWRSFGWSSIIYLSSITAVDPGLYEAAALDGAGRLRRIWHVTLPALAPLIVIQFIMSVGGMLGSDTNMTILLYQPSTYETADVIGSYLYRENLLKGNYSYGTAAGLLINVINIILLTIANNVCRKFTDYSLW